MRPVWGGVEEVDRQACPGTRFGNCSSWSGIQVCLPKPPSPVYESHRVAGEAFSTLEGKPGMQIQLTLSTSCRLPGQGPVVREGKVFLCLLQGLLLPSSRLWDSPFGPPLQVCPHLCFGMQKSVCIGGAWSRDGLARASWSHSWTTLPSPHPPCLQVQPVKPSSTLPPSPDPRAPGEMGAIRWEEPGPLHDCVEPSTHSAHARLRHAREVRLYCGKSLRRAVGCWLAGAPGAGRRQLE